MFYIFTVAIAIFSIASIYFFAKKDHYGSELPWLVSFVTVISYVVMFGLNAAATEPALYTRWLGYGASCTLLTLSMLEVFGVRGKDQLIAIIMTPLIMLTGFLASIFNSDVLLASIIFGLGCVPFIRLIQILRARQDFATKPIMNYIYFGWMGFPVVFIFSSELLGIIPSITITLSLYLLLDIITKLIFYRSLQKAKEKQQLATQ
jgi:bacteriorhodopsin